MTNSPIPWTTTEQVQTLLGVKVDGIWGPKTSAAYDNADSITRSRADAVMANVGYSPLSLALATTRVRDPRSKPAAPPQRPRLSAPPPTVPARTIARSVPQKSPSVPKRLIDGVLTAVSGTARAAPSPLPAQKTPIDDWLTFEELQPILKEAVAGLKHATLEIMNKKLNLEAGKRRRNGVIEYNTRSVNGSYRGLFQMGRDAWSDIRDKLGFGYDKVFDPRINAKAAALYVENNVRVARAQGYTGPITDDVVYTMHNQGVAGFMRILRGGHVEGNQSAAAKRVIASARNDVRSV